MRYCLLELREGNAAVRGGTGVDAAQPASRPSGGPGAVRGVPGAEGVVVPRPAPPSPGRPCGEAAGDLCPLPCPSGRLCGQRVAVAGAVPDFYVAATVGLPSPSTALPAPVPAPLGPDAKPDADGGRAPPPGHRGEQVTGLSSRHRAGWGAALRLAGLVPQLLMPLSCLITQLPCPGQYLSLLELLIPQGCGFVQTSANELTNTWNK